MLVYKNGIPENILHNKMNQEETVQILKQKHPGRVAAGKKLAESNRKRKEELLKLVQVSAQVPDKELTQEPNKELTQELTSSLLGSFNLYTTGAGVIIFLIGGTYAGYIFYTRVRRASAKNSKPELKNANPLITKKKML